MNFILAPDFISTATADPQVLIRQADTAVTLSATVVDSDGKPVEGADVNWFNLTTLKDEESTITGSNGVATLSLDIKDYPENIYLFPFVAYLGSDYTTGKTVSIRVAKTNIVMPQVSDGNDFILDTYDIRSGVTVTIPVYADAAAGDTVS